MKCTLIKKHPRLLTKNTLYSVSKYALSTKHHQESNISVPLLFEQNDTIVADFIEYEELDAPLQSEMSPPATPAPTLQTKPAQKTIASIDTIASLEKTVIKLDTTPNKTGNDNVRWRTLKIDKDTILANE